MAKDDLTVRTDGLREFRRDLRKVDGEVDKGLNSELRDAAAKVAAEAAILAPRRTGRLAASYRPFSTLRAAGVRSQVPYAPVYEYRKTGTPQEMARVRPVGRAVEHQTDRIVERLGDAVERAADHAGWHSR